jgi:nitric oxide reductase activation protein
MNRFIQFNDEKIDSFLFMQLADLAKTLTKNPNMEVEYGVQSYLDVIGEKIFVSHFWDHRSKEDTVAGLKSDVFLRAIGSFYHTDFQEVIRYIELIKQTSIPRFAKQLFMLAEDTRLEDICIKKRPGTKSVFSKRRMMYKKHFETQLNVNLVKSVYTDALFNSLFGMIHAESPTEEPPSISEPLDRVIPFIRHQLSRIFEAAYTRDIVHICIELVEVLDELLEEDMLNEYFHLPENVYHDEEGLDYRDLKRQDPLQNCDFHDKKKDGDETVFDEEMRTWHRETSDLSKTFLQFDLDQGTQSDLLGEGVREGDEGDQALGVVQGSARQSVNNDYTSAEATAMKKMDRLGGSESYGKENKYAVPIFVEPTLSTTEEKRHYEQIKKDILTYQKKLKNMIEKTLEHKKIQPRTDLHMGRLNKKLVRFFTDKNPRLFYKKHEPSNEIDAVFTLLVDCSASMYDKMEETKRGIVLFHEALQSLKVPHEIVGFWEDTNDATETYQPNYFKHVISFQTCFQRTIGPKVMQLQPEEDNRDGFAIRLMTERLLNRSEKQKFLLVFSDGEPAALGYDQNGIIDTHEAVILARKQGIEVINVFLANGEIDEGQKTTIQNIYGKYSILVSNVEQLPDVLFPLLKKLLYKSI